MAALLSYALTTLADVKESLSIASSDTTKDNLIIRKINQATRQIEAYCGRRFLQTTYTQELYNATQTTEMVLAQRPVVGSVVLEARDTVLNSNDWETVDTQLFFVDNNSGVITTLYKNVGGWGRYRATYTAGYTTIPEDLAEACASLACFYVNNADANDIGKSRIREGNREVLYAKNQVTFRTIIEQLGIDDIIDSYANNPIATNR